MVYGAKQDNESAETEPVVSRDRSTRYQAVSNSQLSIALNFCNVSRHLASIFFTLLSGCFCISLL